MTVTSFGQYVRTIVHRGQLEARETGSPIIEAEHLLLAMASQQGTAPQAVLASVGLDHDAIRTALEREFVESLRAAGVSLAAPIPPSARHEDRRVLLGASARLSVERAVKLAAARERRDPVHLLIGVLGAQHGTVPRALAFAGVDREALVERARLAIN
jgi:ATP-dependent Clp protease ATP-binding subunit ClpA